MLSDQDRTYSPAQLAPIVGVSESTMKRWVDAGYLRAVKTPGGHRKIAIPDLLAFLRGQRRLAPSLEALGLLAARSSEPEATALTPEGLSGLLQQGDVDVARTLLLDEFKRGRPVEDILDRLVSPAMAHVGVLWAEGKIDVYEEHVATVRMWSLLLALRSLLPLPTDSAPLAIGAAPEGDPYVLPSLMAETTLLEMGWRTMNVGPDTPTTALLEAVRDHPPRLVWLSITTRDLPPAFFANYPRLYETAHARGIGVVIGGQGITPELQDRVVASAFGTRLAHLKAFALSISR